MKSQNNYSLFILIPFFASISLGANIYVDNQLPDDCIGTYSVANRDSSGADGDAYNMIQEAANVAVAGDVVLIRGGIYYSTSMISMDGKNGLSGEEITISAFGEEEVIIDGSSITPTGYTPHNSIFYLQDSSFLIIEKISFRNSSNEGSGIYVFRSNDISISNNVFDNLNGHGIRLTGSSNCNVEFNELSGSMMGIHIIGYLSGNPPYANSEFNVIRNNLVYNNIVEPEHSDGIALSGGSFNNTIEDNVAYNNADDGIDSDGHSPGSNYTIIEGNIVFNNGYGGGGDGNGIKVSTNAGGGHLVANNVSFNNGRRRL